MRLGIITGSHRYESQSAKVGKYIQHFIEKENLFKDIYFLNLAHTEIPYWDEGVWNKDEKWLKLWDPIKSELQSSDAYVFVTPEWNGMVPSKLKNLLLFPKGDITGHKPALIVSISSGLGGSYPVNELRTSGYKNTKICFIPDHVIIRNVENVLNEYDRIEDTSDERIRLRLNHTLEMLHHYSKAFKELRSVDFDFNKFPNGM
jgi:NAD(P)H-dependent FMN reductase